MIVKVQVISDDGRLILEQICLPGQCFAWNPLDMPINFDGFSLSEIELKTVARRLADEGVTKA